MSIDSQGATQQWTGLFPVLIWRPSIVHGWSRVIYDSAKPTLTAL